MRVLFLNPTGTLGGAERCILDLAASLRAHMRDLEMGLVVGDDGPLLREADGLGVEIIRLPLGSRMAQLGDSALISRGVGARAAWITQAATAAFDTGEYIVRLRAAIRRFQPSVVHSHGIKMHLLAALAHERTPVVWHFQDFPSQRPLASRALALSGYRVVAAIANSNAVARDVREVLPRVRTTVVHNAIDTAAFTPEGRKADLDALSGSAAPPARTVRVGLVATYARWKGHDIFLRAAQLARAQVSNVRFYVIGGPIYATPSSQFGSDELRRLAHDLELDAHVLFVPFQNRVEDVFRALDIVVHASSRPEPFGRTIAEGMATARAVVASREGGASEIFQDGVDAIGVCPRDERALAAAIVALVTDPERRHAIGTAARASIVKRFSRARLGPQAMGVYSRAGCV